MNFLCKVTITLVKWYNYLLWGKSRDSQIQMKKQDAFFLAWSNICNLISILHLFWNAFHHQMHCELKLSCKFDYMHSYNSYHVARTFIRVTYLSAYSSKWKQNALQNEFPLCRRYAVGPIKTFFFKSSSSFLRWRLGRHILSAMKTDWLLLRFCLHHRFLLKISSRF